MVVLGCVQPLPLMKGSFSSKSRWAGPCSLEYLGPANSHPIHTAAFSQATTKSLLSEHLKSEQRQQSGRKRDVLRWLCLHNCCSWGGKSELKTRLGQGLSCPNRTKPKMWEFQFFSTVFSFGKFRVFNFFNP